MTMDIREFTSLLETYGTLDANWPDPVREIAVVYRDANPEAAKLVDRYAPLDEALMRYEVPVSETRIRSNILSRINTRTSSKYLVDRITGWLLPDLTDIHAIWRPALIASLPLIIGVILGSTVSLGTTDNTDTWDNEISLVALSDNSVSNDAGSLP